MCEGGVGSERMFAQHSTLGAPLIFGSPPRTVLKTSRSRAVFPANVWCPRTESLGETESVEPVSQVGPLRSYSRSRAGPSRPRAGKSSRPPLGTGVQAHREAQEARCQCGDSALLLTHPHLIPVIIILTTDTSSASEDEGPSRRPGRLTSTPLQSHGSIEPWLGQVLEASSSSSSASSHPGGRPAAAPWAATALTGPTADAHIGQ